MQKERRGEVPGQERWVDAAGGLEHFDFPPPVPEINAWLQQERREACPSYKEPRQCSSGQCRQHRPFPPAPQPIWCEAALGHAAASSRWGNPSLEGANSRGWKELWKIAGRRSPPILINPLLSPSPPKNTENTKTG